MSRSHWQAGGTTNQLQQRKVCPKGSAGTSTNRTRWNTHSPQPHLQGSCSALPVTCRAILSTSVHPECCRLEFIASHSNVHPASASLCTSLPLAAAIDQRDSNPKTHFVAVWLLQGSSAVDVPHGKPQLSSREWGEPRACKMLRGELLINAVGYGA